MADSSLHSAVFDPAAKWDRRPACDQQVLVELRSKIPFELPEEYFEFLSISNGGNGSLPVSPLWFQLWAAEEIIENNNGYQRQEFYPELFLIGSNGGGSCIAFDISGGARPVVAMDWYDSKRECVDQVAPTFRDFVGLLGRSDDGDVAPEIPVRVVD
jgi:hypothetical protein